MFNNNKKLKSCAREGEKILYKNVNISLDKKKIVTVIILMTLFLGLVITPSWFPVSSAQEEPEYGGTLKVAFMTDMDTQNVLYTQSWWTSVIITMCYDTLVVFNPDLEIVPWLATSWEVSEDGLEWTFHIVENATWHDGKPLTAEDVAFTFTYIKEKEVPGYLSEVEIIDHVEAVDDYTVKFYLTNKSATFLTRTVRAIPILPKHIWENVDKPEEFKNEDFIGSGMFIFEERVPEQYIKLKTNENYWRGRPYVDEVLIKIYKDLDSMIMALRAGEVDVVPWYPPTSVIPELEADPNIAIDKSPDYYVYIVYWNLKKHPLDVKEFRQALAYATNRSYIAEVLLEGYGEPQYSFLASSLEYWYNPNLPKYEFNLTKAAEILDSLGYVDTDDDGIREDENGIPIIFDINPPSYDPVRVRAAQLMKEWWESIGIGVNVIPLDFETIMNKAWVEHDFDMVIVGDGDIDPDYMLSCMCSWEYVPYGNNPMGYNNSQWDQLYIQQRSEVNMTKRREIIWQMQEIYAEDLPLFPLYMAYCTWPYRTDTFTGYVSFPSGMITDTNPWTWLSVYKVGEVTKPGPPLWTWIAVAVVVVAVVVIVAAVVIKKRAS